MIALTILHYVAIWSAMAIVAAGLVVLAESRRIAVLMTQGYTYAEAIKLIAVGEVLTELLEDYRPRDYRCPPCGDTGVIRDEETGRAWPCRCGQHARG